MSSSDWMHGSLAPSRWQLRDGSLFLYSKTPSDVEERQVHLQGDDSNLRNALDTLASSCMQ